MTAIPVFVFSLAFLFSCGGSGTPTPAQPAERKIVTTSKVKKLPEIVFTEDAVLPDDSDQTLDAIAATLEGNPDIVKLGIQVGAATKELAESRGQVIITSLIGRGILATRLENQPRDSDSGQVDFVIIARADSKE